MAAFVARICGLGRSALGTGGGRAATWGEAASGERLRAVGGFDFGVGNTVDGASPRDGVDDVEGVVDDDAEDEDDGESGAAGRS